MEKAYWEQQRLFDREDVKTYIEDFDGTDEDFQESFGVSPADALKNIDKIAAEKGEIESGGVHWRDAVELALDSLYKI